MSRRRSGRPSEEPLEIFVLDCEALSAAVRGDRRMMAVLKLAAKGDADVVTSALTLVEAHDGRITEQRWDWVMSRVDVAAIGKSEAKAARKLLTDVGLHGHKYAIDACLAVIARRQRGDVTVLTSDVEDLEKLVPETVLVRKV